MKINKVISDEILQTYKESNQKELEKYNLSQHHFKKWEESGCEDEGEYEKYQSAYNEYEGVARVTNAYARTIVNLLVEEET